MFCVNCGERLPEGSRFCTNCGAVLQPEEPRRSKRGAGGRKILIAVVIALAVLIAALGGILLGQHLSRGSGSAAGNAVGQTDSGNPAANGSLPAGPGSAQQPVLIQPQPDAPSQPNTPSQPGTP